MLRAIGYRSMYLPIPRKLFHDVPSLHALQGPPQNERRSPRLLDYNNLLLQTLTLIVLAVFLLKHAPTMSSGAQGHVSLIFILLLTRPCGYMKCHVKEQSPVYHVMFNWCPTSDFFIKLANSFLRLRVQI